MSSSDFQLRGVGDPRLAVHATSPLPAWLWSIDGTRVLWANPVGAKLFGAANSAALAGRIFGPADSHRRQVARLARQLPTNGAIRPARLRGFGQMVRQRAGSGADVGLVALIDLAVQQEVPTTVSATESTPNPAREAPVESAQQAPEMPGEPPPSQDAPAEIALFDAFTDPA